MNKYEKAWLNVSALSHTSINFECYRDEMDIQLIQQLVEKATPIKFVKSYSKYGTESWLCPSCRRKLKRVWQQNNNYCPKCGQKIEWSD